MNTICMKTVAILWCVSFCSAPADSQKITHVGSKKFTENVILADIITELGRISNVPIEHVRELGGTRLLWNGLLRGEIDVYPEYTGTLIQELFSSKHIKDLTELSDELSKIGLSMSQPLGFNNTYAIGVLQKTAQKFNLNTISDLRNHKELRFGFSSEFMDRGDGWPGLKSVYQLPQTEVCGMDHDLAYRGLQSQDIDGIDVYSTDAEIQYYQLKTLIDDRSYFPQYHAVIVWRQELETSHPAFVARLRQLEGKITADQMIAMNARSKLDKAPAPTVAMEFLHSRFGISPSEQTVDSSRSLTKNAQDHLMLVAVSMALAIALAIPLGILAFEFRRFGTIIINVVGIVQTIPSLALLVFMIPLLGIGRAPAIAALFVYSLLPIVRNTYQGLKEIDPSIEESAVAMGLPESQILLKVRLPLITGYIMSGIKTSMIINIGTATLGALIGAGGFGQPILTGIRLDDFPLILSGAIPAAVMALCTEAIFNLLEKCTLPEGLRIR